jgi:hypothetical protein
VGVTSVENDIADSGDLRSDPGGSIEDMLLEVCKLFVERVPWKPADAVFLELDPVDAVFLERVSLDRVDAVSLERVPLEAALGASMGPAAGLRSFACCFWYASMLAPKSVCRLEGSGRRPGS